MADKLPDNVSLNVESMEIGQSIKVEDIKIPGIELLDPKNVTVVAVKVTRVVVEEVTPAVAAAAAVAGTAAVPAAGAATPAGAPAKKAEAKK